MAPSEGVLYPPLDRLKPVAEGLWMVDSGPFRVLGLLPIPLRMTVALADDSVSLISPTRYDPALAAEIERIGPIRHLVAPNTVHWMYLPAWQAAYPQATTWGAPGLADRRAVRRSARIDRTLGGGVSAPWGETVDVVLVPGGFGFHEAVLLHRASRTAILTDLVQGFEPARLSAPMAAAVRLLGNDGGTPAHLRAVVRLRRADAAAGARRLLDFAPERAVVAHGRWFQRDAACVLRRALRWLVP